MKRHVILALVAAMITEGCVTISKPVPDGYTGPTATLKDSTGTKVGDRCGPFFFLGKYEGKYTDNALDASARDNESTGPMFARVKEFSRPIPAHPANFFIVGRTHCAAPFEELTAAVYLVGGGVEFTPQEGAVYVVKGELTPDYSAVWIEDEKTTAQVSNKLIIKGLAKPGHFGNDGIRGPVDEVPPPH